MWIYIYNYDKIIYKESKFPSLTLSYVFSFIERSFVSYFLFTQPCDAELYNFVKENLVIIAGVAIGIAVILVSLNWPHLKFPQPVCRTLWNKSLPQKCGKLRSVMTYNVIWANQKTESVVYRWYAHMQHLTFDITCFPVFVGAWGVISSVPSIPLSTLCLHMWLSILTCV